MTVNLPASPKPKSTKVKWQSASLKQRSPLSFSTQTSARVGAGAWVLEIEYPPMTRFNAGEWDAVLFSVDGFATGINAGPDHSRPLDHYDANANSVGSYESTTLDLSFTGSLYAVRYVSAPAMLIDGAVAAQATSATIDGMDGVGLNRGDYISFSNGTYNELKIVIADAFPDATGQATVSFFPPTRRAIADNAPVTIESPVGEFVYRDNDGAESTVDVRNTGNVKTLILEEFVR